MNFLIRNFSKRERKLRKNFYTTKQICNVRSNYTSKQHGYNVFRVIFLISDINRVPGYEIYPRISSAT